jgi:transcriptional pleiotropic regulator of transition state genes
MTRKVDELGRIVLPAEYREALNIHEKDELEISLKAADEITIKKPVLGCHFCGAAVDLVRIGKECVLQAVC